MPLWYRELTTCVRYRADIGSNNPGVSQVKWHGGCIGSMYHDEDSDHKGGQYGERHTVGDRLHEGVNP